MNGKIHSIVSLSTVDGPGMRYVVFMQGCNLRCRYCHNPDTWIMSSDNLMEEDKLVQKILRCKEYLATSNGGVTFSGGEPLLQIDFLLRVCKKLKENDIHVTIDTCGNVDMTENLKELFKYVDLVLLDIKEINREKHFELTGSYNDKIMIFLQYLKSIDKPVWIRSVYIPGITNPLDMCIESMKQFKNIQKVEVLPYHELGKYKWEELGLKYTIDNIQIPTENECSLLSEKIIKYIKE